MDEKGKIMGDNTAVNKSRAESALVLTMGALTVVATAMLIAGSQIRIEWKQ